MAALFYFGGLIMKASNDPNSSIPPITVAGFYMAILVI
jgi:hypothetical protein